MKAKPLVWHPFAARFDPIEGAEWDAFMESIKSTQGNATQPILFRMKKGKREGLDGRNRERACLTLGIEPTYKLVNVQDADLKDFIIRQNVLRRHMTHELRRMIVAELRGDGESTRQIADTLGVSQATVRNDLDGIKESGEQFCSPDESVEPTPLPETIVGKDGKTYQATQPEKPALTPILCGRCKRTGAVKGCEMCKAERANARRRVLRQPGDDTGHRTALPKNGSVLYSWVDFNAHFGGLVREIDKLGNAYRQKETPAAEGLRRKLAEWHKQFKDWHHAITKPAPTPTRKKK